jgi:putative Holliday junction resolvase
VGRASDDSGSSTLIESSVRRENRKQYVDKIAAVFILQGYLDLLSMRNGADGED